MQMEDFYSIVLRDHESDELYIAEVRTNWDIDRIIKARDEMNQEYADDTNERDDFYEELSSRTWLYIYHANVLDI